MTNTQSEDQSNGQLSDQLLSQLHEQFAINDNDKAGKLIKFISATSFVLGGFGFAYWQFNNGFDNNNGGDHNKDLFFITIAANILLTLLACLCVYFGYCTRRDQFLIYKIREKAMDGLDDNNCKVFLFEKFNPSGKSPISYLIGYYFIVFFFLNIFILCVYLAGSIKCNNGKEQCYYSALTFNILFNIVYYCYYYCKYHDIDKEFGKKEKKTQSLCEWILLAFGILSVIVISILFFKI